MKHKKLFYTFLLGTSLIAKADGQDMAKVTRLYSDADGKSHFEIVHLSALPEAQKIIPNPNIFTTAVTPAEGYIVSAFNKNFVWDWHNPPDNGRYLDIILSGEERIDASDGTHTVLKAGDLLLMEDNIGQGHRAQALSDGVELTIKLAKV